jgi:hypothetical protein
MLIILPFALIVVGLAVGAVVFWRHKRAEVPFDVMINQ